MIIRRATKEDIAGFAKINNRPTMKAWCGEVDGKIVGAAGFALCDGRWLGFCDLLDEARPFKMTIARAAIRAMKELKDQGAKFAYVEMDPDEPRAIAWLVSLGFEPDPMHGENVFRWRA